MIKPTDTEKIQLIAILRVLDLTLDEVVNMLHLGKATIVETEKWLRNEHIQTVSEVLNDEILKKTIERELPILGEDEPKILVRAGFVNRATILVHYERKIPKANLEKKLLQNQSNLAQATEKRIDEKLKNHKDDIAKIVEKSSKITKRTIQRVSADDLKSQYGWIRKIHLDSLVEDAQKLRGRIVNPNLSMRIFNEEEKSIWFYQGFDWRLTPNEWFAIVVPLFPFAGCWIPNFENLKSHLANSNFLKHYNELEMETLQLQDKIDTLANGVKPIKPLWYEKWENVHERFGLFWVDYRQFKPDVIPSYDVIRQLINDFNDLGDFFSETISALRTTYPDLDKKYEELEILLQNVYDDLDKNQIAQDIENGKCPQCPSKQASK